MINTNKSHRTKTLMVANGTWVPVCSCGWVGENHTAEEARIEANGHEVGGLRASSSALASARPVGAQTKK